MSSDRQLHTSALSVLLIVGWFWISNDCSWLPWVLGSPLHPISYAWLTKSACYPSSNLIDAQLLMPSMLEAMARSSVGTAPPCHHCTL